MLHVYIVKTALTGKLPAGTIYFDTPEEETHKMWGEPVTVPYKDFDTNGWKSAWGKMHRIVSDGSGDLAGCAAKIRRLCGEGKPIGTRESRDNLTAEYMQLVYKEIQKKGVKTKDIGKMGKTVEEVTTRGKSHGVTDKKLAACLKRAKAIAALLDEPIE